MIKPKPLAGLLALSMILFAFGCSDDNPVNSNAAALIGTWWFSSFSLDGDVTTVYSELANDNDAVTMSLTFVNNGTWAVREFDQDMVLVFLESGTYSASADSITLNTTMFGGSPVDPPLTSSALYAVTSNTLIFVIGNEHTVIQIFGKEEI